MVERDDDDVNPFAAPQSDLVSQEPEDDSDGGLRSHQIIDAGDVISTSWEIFKDNVGMTLGCVLIGGILINVISLPQNILSGIGDVMEQQGDANAATMFNLLSLCFLPLSVAGQIFIWAGQARMLLNIVRGKRAELSDLFTGARYFWRLLGSAIVFGLMLIIGFILCIVPGTIVALMFGVFVYVLVDQDPPGIECLSLARAVTKDNRVTLFVIGLAAVGINLLGLLALCVGLLFTVPLTTLFIAVAYCKMTGQRTV
ncbi:MAG: hypothetical protein JWP89_6608 [Schlesneria sp.]|nr:hypothetical protein [Schlesneria sp.]